MKIDVLQCTQSSLTEHEIFCKEKCPPKIPLDGYASSDKPLKNSAAKGANAKHTFQDLKCKLKVSQKYNHDAINFLRILSTCEWKN